ncbi:MAG: hypothetical protein RLZZ618_2681 [Pseudomonadota bacterium]|jgi:hypothetical protein
MQFTDNAPFYKLARITGPTYNLLVLKLTTKPAEAEVPVERLDASGLCLNPITEEEVREQVMRAVKDARGERRSGPHVELIQYLGGDSRPVDTYYTMTREILKRVEGASAAR